MIDPFNPEDIPDQALWELSDPDFDGDDEGRDLYYDSCDPEDWHPVDIACSSSVFDKRESRSKVTAPIIVKKCKSKTKSVLSKSYREHFRSNKQDAPTQCTSDYWIHAYGKNFDYTSRAGKWLVFCPKEYIDDAWEQIKDATEQGLLGGHSKVSTLKGEKGKEYVCCVFTRDWKDEEDVMRVREVLRDLGFEKPLPYKTDEDTLKGKYANKGHKGISKYYE
jgi:hypothetical protein